MYSAVSPPIVMSAVEDIIELLAPSDAVCIIHEVRITQELLLGDASEEQLHVRLNMGANAGSGTPVAITARPHQEGSAAFGGTVEQNPTQATSNTVIVEEFFNLRVGWLWLPPPEGRIVVSPSRLFQVELASAPDGDTTISCNLIFEELGG